MSSAATRVQPKTVTAPTSLFSSPEKRTVVLCLLLVVATLAAYNPVNRNGFVNFDDDRYIVQNSHIAGGLNGQTALWAFTNYYEANWHPLTWLSHALDVQLFGLNPVGHHYVNVFLHALNAVLLFWVLQSATRKTWPSLMVAALFALHPVNVESVAWAAERKNVLSMLFLLLALRAYGWYGEKPSVGKYALVAGSFACGLMAKPQVITLPFVLLLWDYWPLGRFSATAPSKKLNLVWEKIPLFGLALVSAVITMRAQKAGGAIHNFAAYSFPVRLENAIVAYARYIGKALWPTRLSPLYPHPLDLLRGWQVAASAVLLTAITLAVIRSRRHGYLLTGWFWFLGTLVPMIGLIQVGEQAMADRYAYLPFIGLFLMVCWGVEEWAQGLRTTRWLSIPALVVLAVLGGLTYRQVGFWRNSETLWSYALQVSSVRSYKAHFNLAMAYDQQARFDEAIQQLRQSIDPRDDDPQIHLGLGIYEQRHGHAQDARAEFESTVRLARDPGLRANALVNLGLLAQKSGNYAEAVGDYTRAMGIEPTAVGYLLLAKAAEQAGDVPGSQAALARAKAISADLEAAQKMADELMK